MSWLNKKYESGLNKKTLVKLKLLQMKFFMSLNMVNKYLYKACIRPCKIVFKEK